MSTPNFVQSYQDNLSLAVTDNYFVLDYVDSGTLYWTFERFSAGAQWLLNGSSKVELFYDANGDNQLVLIDAIYTASETYQHEFDINVKYPYTANVSRVLVRRTLFGAGAREIYAQWQGMVI